MLCPKRRAGKAKAKAKAKAAGRTHGLILGQRRALTVRADLRRKGSSTEAGVGLMHQELSMKTAP